MAFWSTVLGFPRSLRKHHWKDVPNTTQEQIFRRILSDAKKTVIAQKYNLTKDISYEAFRERVPVFSYETLLPYIERMIAGEADVLTSGRVSVYAKSSGTTSSRSKYIPTPKRYLKGNHLRGGKDLVAAYLASTGETKLPVGKTISITGSIAPIADTPSVAGDISALILRSLPWWTSHTRPYDTALALSPSWPEKSKQIAKETVHADIVSLYGVPTWMMEILELVRKEAGEQTIAHVWPKLEVFFHGGVSFAPYEARFKKLIGKDIEYRGVYNASEGMVAFEDNSRAHPGEFLLCTDHDIFFEFVPQGGGDPLPLRDVVAGMRYAILITTTSGLWRYQIGDVVMFTSTKPYRLRIVGRTTQYMNAFGEEVVADNAVRAVAYASEQTEAIVREFTAAPLFTDSGSQGVHEWIFEFSTPPEDMERFTDILDAKLQELNSDYEAKRAGDVVLGRPKVHSAPEGTFLKYLESKGKLGGQNKVPVLSNERTYITEILTNM